MMRRMLLVRVVMWLMVFLVLRLRLVMLRRKRVIVHVVRYSLIGFYYTPPLEMHKSNFFQDRQQLGWRVGQGFRLGVLEILAAGKAPGHSHRP